MQPYQFVNQVRGETAYPAFRSVTRVFAWVLYALAAVVAVAGVVGSTSGAGGPAVLVFGVVLAALIALIGKVLHEATLMLADLADAALHIGAAAAAWREKG